VLLFLHVLDFPVSSPLPCFGMHFLAVCCMIRLLSSCLAGYAL
jgi:hypothetical protein